MKANEILKQVLRMCEPEQQGIIHGGLCDTWREWLRDWFGVDAILTVGLIDPQKEYFYSFDNPLQGVADAIIKSSFGAKVYIYEIEQ